MRETAADSNRFGSLTEEEVKHRFVPFLKDFYKNRYESVPGSIHVEMDNVSAEGWVADGKLTFRKEDGSAFVCTYEATSLDKSEEVKYRLNTHYFVWDCSAFGAAFAAAGYFFFYLSRLPWLIQLKGIGNIGLLLGLFIIGFFGWYFSMQNWRKYRYIFAIQQFRQYFADEQWIALADDVFPSPNDPFYLELRNQCVYNGVGLAIVPFEGNVRKISDPSRLGIYGKDKKMADWLTRSQWYQQMSENVSAMAEKRPKAPDSLTVLWNQIYRPLHYLVIDPFNKYVWGTLSKPLGEANNSYSRFMSAQTVQKWVAILSLAFISPLLWKVLSFKTEEVADLEDLQRWRGGKNPEDQFGYVVDGEAIPYDGKPPGVPKQYPVRNEPEEDDDVPTIDMSGGADEDDGPTIDMADEEDEKPASVKPKPVPKPKPPAPASSPCDLLNRTGWIVQESSYKSKELAINRANSLKKADIDGHYASQTCLPKGLNAGYIVWLGTVQSSEETANAQAAIYRKKLQKSGLSQSKLFVRRLK
jgi:hypothetical protein